MKKLFLFITLLFNCLITSAFGQGSFQNLNFETIGLGYGIMDQGVTIPGWTASPAPVVYNEASLGGAAVTINSIGSPYPNGFAPLQGSLSVILWAGAGQSSFITQSGLVPGSAHSILMDIAFRVYGPFTVTLGSQQIAMSPLQVFGNYTIYGGDVTAEAGQTESLTITESGPPPPTVPPSGLVVDDIQFSSNIVPEPSAWSLMICGGVSLGALGLLRKR